MSYQNSCQGTADSRLFWVETRSTLALHDRETLVGCEANTNGRLTPAPYKPIGSPTCPVKSQIRMPSGALKANPCGVVVIPRCPAVPVATLSAFNDRLLVAASPVI